VTRPDAAQVAFGYDLRGNVTSVTPPARTAATLTYNPLDALATFTEPPNALGAEPAVITFDYTPARALDRVVYPGGAELDIQYDPANGHLSSAVTSAGAYMYDYAANGLLNQLKSVDADGEHTSSLSYDGSFLTATTWGGTSGLVQGGVRTVRDVDFLVDKLQVNSADVVDYGYDSDELLASVNGLQLTRAPGSSQLSGTTLGPLVTTQDVTPFNETSALTATWAGTPYYSETIGLRDKSGRIRQRIDIVQVGGVPQTRQFTYDYDLTGRLTNVTTDSVQSSHYAWDDNGNLTGRETPAGTTRGRYDDAGRLTRLCPEDSAGNATPIPGLPCYSYTYRASGELLTKTTLGSSSSTTYDYDVLGGLRGVSTPSGRTLKYELDALGRRVGKTVDGVKQWGLLYIDQLRPIAQLDASNAVVATFAYATLENAPDLMTRGGVVYRFIHDHLGSVRLVVNATTGAVAQRLDYDELGNVLVDTNPGFQPFGFAGGLYDADTGLVRFGARDYDAVTGRWTAKDPLLFGGGDTNLYRYCYGDPVNWVDTTGRSPWQPVPGHKQWEYRADNPHVPTDDYHYHFRHNKKGDYARKVYEDGRQTKHGKGKDEDVPQDVVDDTISPYCDTGINEPSSGEGTYDPLDMERWIWEDIHGGPGATPFLPLPFPTPVPLPAPGFGPLPVPVF
jgi:RHS repeat-associated protein